MQHTTEIGSLIGPEKELRKFISGNKGVILAFLRQHFQMLTKMERQRLKQFERKLLRHNDAKQPGKIKEYIPLNKKLLCDDTRLNFSA
jgi:hypothetical protein